MNTNAILTGLVALTLGVAVFIAVSLPDSGSLAHLQTGPSSTTDTSVARAIDELRAEVKRQGEQLDQRVSTVERAMALQLEVLAEVTSLDASTLEGALPYVESEATESFTAKVAEVVKAQFEGNVEELASKQRVRSANGQWKAPMDELANELDMDDYQKDRSEEAFDRARDDAFQLLTTQRPDGGNLLDDLVSDIQNGTPEPYKVFMERISSEHIPGTNRTYISEMMALSELLNQELGEHLSEDQVRKLKALQIAPLEVQTGHDPIGDYIRASML